LVVGVWAPEKIEYVIAKGKSNIADNIEMKPELRFRIGSMTKTFVITVLLQLVEEQKLKLDDTIDKFFPDFPNGANITIRQLANMTSGIYNYTETEAFNDTLANNPHKKWAPEELIQIALENKPYFEPGKGFHYSNTNTILIGLIIEKLTGNTLKQEIENRIIKTLDMNNTSFLTDGYEMTEPYCHGYMIDPTGTPIDNSETCDISWGWAAGSMISNLDDLKIWAEALGTGKLLSPETQKERLEWVTIEGSLLKYGLGIFTFYGFIGHNGGLPGYTNITVYDPVHNATIIVFYNGQNDNIKPDHMMGKIAKLLYPDN
jgi:D-alanyl-D-alanine carboxypeptidase